MKSKIFNNYASIYKELVANIYDAFKDQTSDAEKQQIINIVEAISLTGPQETFEIQHPKTGEVICTLYTPEDKMLATDVLKNMGGNINYNPQKFSVKRKVNSQEYKDAWNKIIKKLDTQQYDDETLAQIRDAINNV
jgi:hypothetical protein